MKCSLTGKYIKEPVYDKYGFLYEKEEILNYIKNNNKYPHNYESMTINDIKKYKENKEKIKSIHIIIYPGFIFRKVYNFLKKFFF